MRILIALNILFSLLACGQTQDSVDVWQSKYRDLQFKYRSPWTLLPAMDTKSQTLVGVIDNRDGKSYIIQYFDDISTDSLSTEDYLDGIKETMLKPNSKNKLILQDSVIFHKKNAHRQIYLMYTKKWGLLKQFGYTIRTGKELITIQMLFPTTESDINNNTIHSQLVGFDKSVKLNE